MRTLARSFSPPHDPPAVDRAALLDGVLATFRSPTYEPPVIPATAFELLALARRPETRFEDIARICEQDPMVAARVLRVAQSAYFARGARVATLRDAVVRVGVATLAHIFLEVTLTMRVFRAPGYDAPMGALRRHSAVTAHLARILAPAVRADPERAFTCGLLHDVGVAAAAFVVGARAPFELAWSVILDVHAEAGRIVCRCWDMPEEIAALVGSHHLGRTGRGLSPLTCTVRAAEWLAGEAGYALDGEALRARPDVELRLLGVDDARLAQLHEDATRIAASLG